MGEYNEYFAATLFDLHIGGIGEDCLVSRIFVQVAWDFVHP